MGWGDAYPSWMDDPRLDRITREAARRGRSPGWRVALPDGSSRLFPDADAGTPGLALDAAIAYRDGEPAANLVPLPTGRVTLAPGVYLMAQRSKGRAYPVIRADARDASGAVRSIVRSLHKHAPEAALRDAAAHRFEHRAGETRFEYETADALYADALAAYQAHVDTA